jgi:hypothetical protein
MRLIRGVPYREREASCGEHDKVIMDSTHVLVSYDTTMRASSSSISIYSGRCLHVTAPSATLPTTDQLKVGGS